MSSAVPSALLVGAHGLGEERHQDPVDDEARPVGRDDDLLAQLAGEVADGRLGRVVGRGAADELDQRHHRHGAEEVHADEPGARGPRRPTTPAGRWRSTRCWWRRRRPAGRWRPARPTARDLTSMSSNTASTTRSASAAAARSSVGTRRASVASRSSRGEPALRDGPLEVARDPVAAGLGARQLRLVQGHLLADRRVDLGDAVAHQPGAGDEHALDRHAPSLLPPGTPAASEARRANRARPSAAITHRHEEGAAEAPRHREGASTTGAIPNERSRNDARRPDDRSPLRLGDARDREREERGNANAIPTA